jgi:hypothetical protein
MTRTIIFDENIFFQGVYQNYFNTLMVNPPSFTFTKPQMMIFSSEI